MEVEIGLDASDDILVEGPVQSCDGHGPVLAVDDELGYEAVIVRRHHRSGEEGGIHPDTGSAGGMVFAHPPGRRHEGRRVLRIDPAFDGMAVEAHRRLRDGQRRPGRNAQLLPDQVDPGDLLGHRVFDLEAGVHLDEMEAAAVEEEFEGAHAAVTDLRDRGRGPSADSIAIGGAQNGGGGLLDNLLVPTLYRAVAFAEMDCVAVAVDGDLNFDVARVFYELLDEDPGVAEGSGRLPPGQQEGGGEIPRFAGDLHSASAASGRRLQQYGIPYVGRRPGGLLLVPDRVRAARDGRDPHGGHGLLCGDLVPHRCDVIGARTDEYEAVVLHHPCEGGVLREEAQSRMHRLRPGHVRSGEDGGHVEVAVLGRGGADADAFIGQPHVHRLRIGGRVHGDGMDAHVPACPNDPQCDLAAVGDQDLVEHASGYSRIIRISPYSTGWPVSTRILRTIPSAGDGIWLKTFIASTIRRVSPICTLSPILTKGGCPGSGWR